MKLSIKNISIFHYTLPLVKNIKIGGKYINDREGLLLRICNDHGHIGWGEIAPLPGLHKETLNDCILQIIEVKKQLLNQSFDSRELNSFSDISKFSNKTRILFFFNRDQGLSNLYSSVRFGLEMALIRMMLSTGNMSLRQLLAGKESNFILLNALLSGKEVDFEGEVKRLLKQGYQSFKLKVGRDSIDEDIKRVDLLRRLIGDRQIRLDANRAWSLEQAVYFGKKISANQIEYIEEPVEDPANLSSFYKRTRVPIALDETLMERVDNLVGRKGVSQSIDVMQKTDGVKAWIIKPSLVGSVLYVIQLIKRAGLLDIRPVLSSSFLSGVGHSFLLSLSTSLIPGEFAMGLNTFIWFQQDVLKDVVKEGWKVEKGGIFWKDSQLNDLNINQGLLQEIES